MVAFWGRFVPPYRGMECAACGHDNLEGARFCANCGVVVAHRDPTNPLIGQVIGGRYRVTRVIGEGGMGIVYEAEQQMGTTVRKVAVKTLHTELSRDPAVTARFHRECGTVAQLEHPNTIKVYDFGTMPDGTLYIAMEFLAGKPLDQVISSTGAMSPKRVLHLLQQVAGSLEEAHDKGIIHRDLKPENVILIDRAGEKDVVKLLDFGIAARTESASAEREAKLTQQGMVLGTPPYMSPEQFTGKALDRRSDIYSLAIMAYEMLTTRLPFEATTPWQWATEHMTAQPRPFEEFDVSTQIPQGMRAAILRALSKNREERFSTVREFVEALSSTSPAPVYSDDTMRATAAMEAAPDFGAAMVNNPTAAMPAQPVRAAAAAVTAAAVAVPAASAAAQGGRNPMLLVAAGAGVLLLGGGLALALRSGSNSSADSLGAASMAIPLPAPAAPPSAAAPVTDPEPLAEETADEQESPTPVATGKGGTGKPTPPVHSPAGTSKTPAASTAKTPPAASAKPSAGGGDSCSRCQQLAGSGDYIGARTALNACTDPEGQNRCLQRARSARGAAMRKAADSGNCALAKQIQAAASAMGAGARPNDPSLMKCK